MQRSQSRVLKKSVNEEGLAEYVLKMLILSERPVAE